MENNPINAKRTVTLAGAIASSNAIKTSIATSTSVQTYSGAGLTGTLAGGPYSVGRTVSVTTTSSSTTYNTTNAIVVTGKDVNGNVITDNLLLTQSGGNETIVSTKSFASVTSIAVPAQLGTGGAFVFGVYDVAPGTEILEIRIKTAGTLVMTYHDGSSDTLSALAGDRLPYSPTKISGTSTAQDVTLAFKY